MMASLYSSKVILSRQKVVIVFSSRCRHSVLFFIVQPEANYRGVSLFFPDKYLATDGLLLCFGHQPVSALVSFIIHSQRLFLLRLYSSRCRRWYLFNIFSILCRRRPIQHLVRCRPHILFANIVHSKGEVITPLIFIFGAVGHGGRFLKLFVVPPLAYCFILYYIIL